MRYANAHVFRNGRFVFGGFSVENGLFADVFSGETDADGVDLGGAYAIPGLVDIHTHGNSGADFSDGDPAGLEKMARYLAKNGVTSFAPTSLTLPLEPLKKAFRTAKTFADGRPSGCARIMGINMEGPFFSEKKKGAQNPAFLRAPDLAFFNELYEAAGGLLRIVDIAPELPGAMEFIRAASETCVVSLAHTDADYDTARQAFDAGARHMTHLFNAMPGLHHRAPGPVAAGSEREDVFAELICDGLHVHPAMLRLAFRLFPGRICMISDALNCCGMPEGTYTIDGRETYVKGRLATLADGTIAGSASNLYDCLLTAVNSGVPKEEAILSATANPARELGAADKIGAIAPGCFADFVVCDEDLTRRAVYVGGVKTA
ncbi:MAG: N-acetylglucosamine-6-phosphate deacetylase [Clostridia bacterium]|nr:N-acetylglucosamine-6-phosphate deacetylase [Clostridia bacterium]